PTSTPTKDECLCRAYIQVSEDGIIDNGHDGMTFWERVGIWFDEQLTGAKRTQDGMESRMRLIDKGCSTWKRALRKATSLQRSGTTHSNVQVRNKKGKASTEPSELRQKHVARMLEFGVNMKDRAKATIEYEGERLELQTRKGKRGDEQWEYTKKEKDHEAGRWEFEKREKEAALMRQNMEILEKDLSKMTPRKKKYRREEQNKIL
ncbi:hypothetical protein LINPERHAP2_LOCUS16854, partial [Linum perenne]